MSFTAVVRVGLPLPLTKPKYPSACSPTKPAALAASTAALSLAGSAKATPALRPRAISITRARFLKLRILFILQSLEQIGILLNRGLHFSIQFDADIGIQLRINIDGRDFDPDGGRASAQEHQQAGGKEKSIHGFAPA